MAQGRRPFAVLEVSERTVLSVERVGPEVIHPVVGIHRVGIERERPPVVDMEPVSHAGAHPFGRFHAVSRFLFRPETITVVVGIVDIGIEIPPFGQLPGVVERHARLDGTTPCPRAILYLFDAVQVVVRRFRILFLDVLVVGKPVGLFINARIHLERTYRTVYRRRTVQDRSGPLENVYLLHVFHRDQVPCRTTRIGPQHRHVVQQQHHAAAHAGTETATAPHLGLVIHDGQAGHAFQGAIQRGHVVLGDAFQPHHLHGLDGSLAITLQALSLDLHGIQGGGRRAQAHVKHLFRFPLGERDGDELVFIAQITEVQLHFGLVDGKHVVAVHIGNRALAAGSHDDHLRLRQHQFVLLIINLPFYHVVMLGLKKKRQERQQEKKHLS